VVKFVFSNSKLKKQPFFAENSKSRRLSPFSDAHAGNVSPAHNVTFITLNGVSVKYYSRPKLNNAAGRRKALQD